MISIKNFYLASKKRVENFVSKVKDFFANKKKETLEVFNGDMPGGDGGITGEVSSEFLEKEVKRKKRMAFDKDKNYWSGKLSVRYSFTGMRNSDYGSIIERSRLYNILSDAFNKGERLLTPYFAMFEDRPVYNKVIELWNEGINRLIDSKINGVEDVDFSQNNYNAENISLLIKDDIISCFSTGIIPFKGGNELAESTIKVRQRYGITNKNKFYATEELLSGLNVFVYADNDEIVNAINDKMEYLSSVDE